MIRQPCRPQAALQMSGWQRVLVFSLLALSFLGITGSRAEDKRFGPFQVETASGIILLNGEIDAGAALNFRRALAAASNPKLLVLNSPGGLVPIALLIADDVHQRALSTLIPEGAQCYSACSFVFLAGRERAAEGELGVHQISSDAPDIEGAQLAISDIIDVLNRFDTPTEVLTIMFRTPASQMYVFSSAEVRDYGINRGVGLPTAQQGIPAEVAGIPAQRLATSDHGGIGSGGQQRQQPARVAVYVGLDFYGGDIRSLRAPDLQACASECLASGQSCRAFTYNSDESRRVGPNCFMKNGRSQPDGNADAISGVLLRASDPDPDPLEVGVIDPRSGLVTDVDIPFKDISEKPTSNTKTAQECRISCVALDRCEAFTFVKAKKQCWLKSSSEGAQRRRGMVSGVKDRTTYSPAEIIELN